MVEVVYGRLGRVGVEDELDGGLGVLGSHARMIAGIGRGCRSMLRGGGTSHIEPLTYPDETEVGCEEAAAL